MSSYVMFQELCDIPHTTKNGMTCTIHIEYYYLQIY
jgi:hypothetical protein